MVAVKNDLFYGFRFRIIELLLKGILTLVIRIGILSCVTGTVMFDIVRPL